MRKRAPLKPSDIGGGAIALDYRRPSCPDFLLAGCSSFKMLYLSAKSAIHGESPAMEFTSMARLTPPIRLVLFACGLAAGCLTLSAATFAQQSCAEDLKRLSDRRGVELDKINNLVKAAKGKPMNPAVFCSQSGGLKAAEDALIAYMEKNKDWCGVPDEALTSLKENHLKSIAFANKACTVAAQMKKREAAGANGENAPPPAQPLPAGPL
jgi:hypothetical protein